ncbi:MAG: 50S ribosomal protein L32 [Elusimicrobia bacterium RIFCSPHIGHO2_02_FULL_57_9]|nr:MAG: 50S ribosomal protein L32 [Elusimicrobia bacterium RIFCSPHIGHO2_02_FULL_57_9]
MPNPKRRHTRSRRDSRRSQNWKLDRLSMSPCANPDCGRLRPPHTVCPHCGFYNGKIAVVPKRKEKTGEGGEKK